MASKNKEEYRKQIARIKRAMKRIESAGYRFTEEVLPDQEPARVTRKQIEELERMNTERLYYRTIALDDTTGEILATGRRLTKNERRRLATEVLDTALPSAPAVPKEREERTAPVSLMTKTIIDNFKSDAWSIAAHTDKPEAHLLVERTMNWLDAQIAKFGEEMVANALEKALSDGLLKRWEVYYKENENYEFVKALTSYIADAGEEYIEDVAEAYLMGVYDFADQGTDEYEITEG